jgi:hypothetical protein
MRKEWHAGAGRWIEVEDVTPDIKPKSMPPGSAVVVPMEWIGALAAVPGGQALLLLRILQLSWARKSETVTLSNEVFRDLGVDRRRKRIKLQRLQDAGLISVYWPGGKQSPRVTILYPSWHPALSVMDLHARRQAAR